MVNERLGFRSAFVLGKLGHDLREVLRADAAPVSDRLVAALNRLDPALERRAGVVTLAPWEYRTLP